MARHSMILLTVNSGGYKTKDHSHQNMRDYSSVISAARNLASGYHTLKEQFTMYKSYASNTFSYTNIFNNTYIFDNKAKFKNAFVANWKTKTNFCTEKGHIHTCSNPKYRGANINTISYKVSNSNIRNNIDTFHIMTLYELSEYDD